MTEAEFESVIESTLFAFARARGEYMRLVEALDRTAAKGQIARKARDTIRFRANRLSDELARTCTQFGDFAGACRLRMKTLVDEMGG